MLELKQTGQSLDCVQVLDCLHESAYAHVVGAAAHQFLCLVVHRVELSCFVAEPDSLEKGPDLLASPCLLEIVFTDSHLSEGRWEQQVDCLWVVAIVLKE